MTTERRAAVAGLLYVALDVVVGVMAGAPPAPGAPNPEITDYITGHRAGLAVGLWLFGLASVALLWWFGSLWGRMVAAEGGTSRLAVVSLAGLVLGGTLAFASSSVMATLGLVADAGIGGDVRLMYALAAVLLSASGFGLGAHLLATNLLAIRTGMLATGLAGLGLLSAAAFLVSAVLGAVDNDATSNTVSLIGFALWLSWIVGVSWRMWSSEAEAGQRIREPMAA